MRGTVAAAQGVGRGGRPRATALPGAMLLDGWPGVRTRRTDPCSTRGRGTNGWSAGRGGSWWQCGAGGVGVVAGVLAGVLLLPLSGGAAGALGLASGAQGAAMPKELAPVAIGALQRDAGPAYQVRGEDAENAAQGWRLKFYEDRVEVRSAEGKEPWALKLGVGRLGAKGMLRAYPVVKREVSANRVSYDRGVVEEWYVNGPLGLEQGFTVRRPLGPKVVVELDIGWPVQVTGAGVRLRQGEKRLYYGALHAVDAKGRVLPTVLRVVEGRVRLEVVTQGAAYPLTIDPLLTEEAKLTTSDAAADDRFGASVALSADGTQALIGAFFTDCSAGVGCGAAYMFVRQGQTWVEQQKLTALDAADDAFGGSVALSARGTTALIGAFIKNCSTGEFACGAAYVFVRQRGAWVEQQKLTASDAAAEAVFGRSVTLSARGTTALIGAHQAACSAGDNCGAAYVFRQ
jgi:FG-GAP repeat